MGNALAEITGNPIFFFLSVILHCSKEAKTSDPMHKTSANTKSRNGH